MGYRAVVGFLIVLVLSACTLKIAPPQINASLNIPNATINVPNLSNYKVPNITIPSNGGGNGTLGGLQLSCSAVLESSYGGVVSSGSSVTIDLRAAGGLAPYSFSGGGTFSAVTTITRVYTNFTGQNQVVNDSVNIKDSLGLTATCGFRVTVRSSSNPSNLTCALNINPASPTANNTFAIGLTASGGTGYYAFGGLSLGASGQIVGGFQVISQNQATAIGLYNAAGAQSISAEVEDSSGNIVSCSVPVTVQPALALQVAANPSNIVDAATPITLSAAAQGFTGTPVFSFTTSESGVTIVQGTGSSANTATITSNSALVAHDFFVQVAATGNGQQVVLPIHLGFTTQPQALLCEIYHDGGDYFVPGDTVAFHIVASHGEPLQIVYFDQGLGGNYSGPFGGSMDATYFLSGPKFITAYAQSIQTGAFCNAGSPLQDFVFVQ
jgi:hypothetical protein